MSTSRPRNAARSPTAAIGVGCDQILVVETPTRPDADFRYRIWNADGGEVEQCGNGARCFVKFVRDRGLTDKRRILVETAGGMIAPELAGDGLVTVDMGVPRFAAAEIPFAGDGDAPVRSLIVDGDAIEATLVSMGNPHAVQVVADVDRAPVTTEGPKLECDRRFPHGVNAGYMQVVDRATIRLRVWERGAGRRRRAARARARRSSPGSGAACSMVVCASRRAVAGSRSRGRARGGR